ncbi:pilZ domain protein [Geobacter sp. OR-1]|uniref:PilZ domain-containing protein n=1 Tax=Geobacter sp. OR-1 TaxID=1266765 RepID=UPI000543F03B|nr:PilZ domain-containing protein [Geobacter sp. OR-1]GAM09557.1 pilZ domain protein [Geobacter sp. OR-1]
MAEKRYLMRHRRRFALRFGENEATRLGFTEDISTEGMFIRTTNTYAPGTLLKVTITLPEDQSISFTGKVMWAKRVPPQMARLVKKAGFGLKIESFIEGEELYRHACEKSLTPA